MHHRLISADVDRQISGQRFVFDEIALYTLAFVAERDGELVKPEMRVDHHDVPQDRPASDLDHGFRPDSGFFDQPRTFAAGEDCDFHKIRPNVYLGFRAKAEITNEFRIDAP